MPSAENVEKRGYRRKELVNSFVKPKRVRHSEVRMFQIIRRGTAREWGTSDTGVREGMGGGEYYAHCDSLRMSV